MSPLDLIPAAIGASLQAAFLLAAESSIKGSGLLTFLIVVSVGLAIGGGLLFYKRYQNSRKERNISTRLMMDPQFRDAILNQKKAKASPPAPGGQAETKR